MAGRRYASWRQEQSGLGPSEPRRGRRPSRGWVIGVGAAATFAVVLSLMGTFAVQASSSSSSEEVPTRSETAAQASPAPTPEPKPRPTTLDEPREGTIAAREMPSQGRDDVQAIAEVSATASSSTVQGPHPVASSWSAPPEPAEPVLASPVEPGAERLAAAAADEYGVVILLDGWDWGADEDSRLANVEAVIDAIERLPNSVVAAAASHEHGPLSLLSNDIGRTLDGWQPYGSHPMSYYTNSDQGPDGYHASNKVVLSVGATSMSVGHELLHAYQFRNVGPDEYVLALLQPEMRSFMEATGWRQVATDEQVRQALNQPWSTADELFVYEGRPLNYTTAGGSSVTLTPANPAEAFAASGAMYYTRPSWVPQPEWPEYWSWFDTHLG